MNKIYMSYSSHETAVAQEIMEGFSLLDYDILSSDIIGRRGISYGEDWISLIASEIREREIFVFILSQHSLASEYCLKEYEYALALNKRIIPIVINEDFSYDNLPVSLSQINWASYKSIMDIKIIVESLENIQIIPMPNPLPPKPTELFWERGNVPKQKYFWKYLPIISGVISGLLGVLIALNFFTSDSILLSESQAVVPPKSTKVPKSINKNSTPILKICGSNMINLEIMPKLVKKFLREQDYSNIHGADEFEETDNIYGTKNNQEYVVEIRADGTRNGYDDLLRQECDMAVSYGEMWQDIADEFQRKLKFNIKSADNKYEDAFAFDAIAIVVNKSNGIDSLSSHQIRDIFNGDIRDWSQIEGSSLRGKIELYTMHHASGIYHEFIHDLTKKGRDGKYHDLVISTHQEFRVHEKLEMEVAKHPNAIGFVSNEHVTRNVKLLALNESGHKIYPTAYKIISEEYDLSDEIFFYTRPKSVDLVKEFRKFIDSVPIQEWIANNTKLLAADIITDDELEEEERERRSILNYGGLNSQYKKIMRQLVKTPVNFHFESGRNKIDHEVRIHLRQLEYLLNHHPEYNDKEIVLIGLSDSNGSDGERNRNVSKKRAESVRRILEEDKIIASHKIKVCAFGAHTPLLLEVDADNEHERRVDRRVEVWIDADGDFSSPLCQ